MPTHATSRSPWWLRIRAARCSLTPPIARNPFAQRSTPLSTTSAPSRTLPRPAERRPRCGARTNPDRRASNSPCANHFQQQKNDDMGLAWQQGPPPSVLVFDVNETLIDIEAITPLLAQIFGDPKAMREWFAQLVMYSMTTALARCYVDYFTLGQAVLRMLADIHQVSITDADLQHLTQAMLTLPAHPDVEDGLKTLRSNGFRLATLTNSPPNTQGPSPLEHAGLGGYFERQFSVDPHRTYKPDATVYRYVCEELGVQPERCMTV